MELWIRSQDKKKLHIVKQLDLDNDETGIFDLETYVLLGKYKTKERALEVLDEIENLIFTKFIIKDASYEEADIKVKSEILCNMSKIYEMPEK